MTNKKPKASQRFSKPLSDVAAETADMLREDAVANKRVAKLSQLLNNAPKRNACPLCASSPSDADHFTHRGIAYARCGTCGHICSLAQPPDGYPERFDSFYEFDNLYPLQEASALIRRKKHIYRPKLQWILDSAHLLVSSPTELLAANWLEIGCGEGLFLSTLQDAGAQHIGGIETHPALVERANLLLGKTVVHQVATQKSLACLKETNADILAAFFVLEHLDDLNGFFKALGTKPKGTIFIFAVPVYGFGSLLEGSTPSFYPRNLDNVVHTQIFTDQSISFGLKMAGFQKTAQWTFGQDASDLRRMLVAGLQGNYPKNMLDEISHQLAALNDPLQHIFDTHGLADSRHIIAIRRDR